MSDNDDDILNSIDNRQTDLINNSNSNSTQIYKYCKAICTLKEKLREQQIVLDEQSKKYGSV